MKCPVCKQNTLSLITLYEGLPANQCSTCNGIWLSSNQYLTWVRTQEKSLPGKQMDEPIRPELKTDSLKLCPESGHIMKRFKVLSGIDFFLDRCSHCNGIWFDGNEWDSLVSRNMQDKVNQFFTAPWQDKLREKETRANMEKIYREKLGADDYRRIQEIRIWLEKNPSKATLIAFLQADDPFEL